MLMDRLFEPDSDQIVYHYCSADSFQAILESKKLRFSDINMLNDSSEHKWGYSIFEAAANRLIDRKDIPKNVPVIKQKFFEAVDEVLSHGQLLAHPFIASLSLNGNSLDQWRNYADDGRGYAIGFRAKDLMALPISFLKVSYDIEEQIQEMITALLAIHSRQPELPLKGTAREDANLISVYMTALKHPCFHSEQEIRCLRAISLEKVNTNFRFKDLGGHLADGTDVPGEKICYATRSGALTAYVDIPYMQSTGECPIAEIVIGPKNITSVGNLFLFLGSLDYSIINLRSSNLPYR